VRRRRCAWVKSETRTEQLCLARARVRAAVVAGRDGWALPCTLWPGDPRFLPFDNVLGLYGAVSG
jgi:hypothetical protein